MAYAQDTLILRDGQAVSGKVLKKEFKIKTSFGDVTIKKENIALILFKAPDETSFPPSDEIRTTCGDDLKGKLVQTMTISFVTASNNQTARIPRDKIHSLIFLTELDTESGDYPQLG